MIEVYKYGGNVLKEEKNREVIYEFLKSKINEGIKVFVVVSAFGREKDCFSTDNLSKNIEKLSFKDKDLIMTFGEIYSSLIIKNEMIRENIKVESVNYDEIGIMCDNNYQEGNILGIDMSYLSELINKNDVVIVPGFIAESMEGKIISLGRNTSDLTAIIIAKHFDIEKVNIIKEVDGVYKKDPSKENCSSLISNISYDEMISIIKAGSKMFSLKTLEYAKDKKVKIMVNNLNNDKGTLISEKESDEKILFINNEEKGVKIVFKGMDIFNKIFNDLINKKIKFDDLTIVNNEIFIKANSELINKMMKKYI